MNDKGYMKLTIESDLTHKAHIVWTSINTEEAKIMLEAIKEANRKIAAMHKRVIDEEIAKRN